MFEIFIFQYFYSEMKIRLIKIYFFSSMFVVLMRLTIYHYQWRRYKAVFLANSFDFYVAMNWQMIFFFFFYVCNTEFPQNFFCIYNVNLHEWHYYSIFFIIIIVYGDLSCLNMDWSCVNVSFWVLFMLCNYINFHEIRLINWTFIFIFF